MPNPLIDKLKNALLNGAGNFVEKVGNAIDQNVTNKEEAIKAKTEAEKVANDFMIQMAEVELKKQESEDKAVTDRWVSDMGSDSWMSKNIRPLALASALLFVFLIIITDSTKLPFEVKPEYIELLKTILEIIILAYFGGRSIEKGVSIYKKK